MAIMTLTIQANGNDRKRGDRNPSFFFQRLHFLVYSQPNKLPNLSFDRTF